MDPIYSKETKVSSNIKCIHWMKNGLGVLIIFPTYICLVPPSLVFKDMTIVAGTSKEFFKDGCAIDAGFYDITDIFELDTGDFIISDKYCIRMLSADLKRVSTVAGNPFIQYDYNASRGADPNGPFTGDTDTIAIFSGPSQMAQHPIKENSVLVVDSDKERHMTHHIRELDFKDKCVRTVIGSWEHYPNFRQGHALNDACIFTGGPMVFTQHYGTVIIDYDKFSTFDGTMYTYRNKESCSEEDYYGDDEPPTSGNLDEFSFLHPDSIVLLDNHRVLLVDNNQLRIVDLKKGTVSTPSMPQNITPKIIEMIPNGYVLMIASTEDEDDYLFIIKGFVRNDKPAAKPTKEEIELYKRGLMKPISEGPPLKKCKKLNINKTCDTSDDDDFDFSMYDKPLV